MILRALLIPVILFFLNSCSNEKSKYEKVPVLSSISPSFRAVNMPGFKLIVRGEQFTDFSKIYFGDQIIETSFLSENELECEIHSDLISADTGNSIDLLRIEKNDKNIPVVITNGGGNFSEKIYFNLNDNNSFYDPFAVSGVNDTSSNPAIAVTILDKVFIIYERYEEIKSLYYISVITSASRGTDWSYPLDLFSSTQKIYNPAIAVGEDGNIYTTFYNEKLYFSSSNDSGETWSEAKVISSNTSSPIESKIVTDNSGGINIMWIISSSSTDTSVYFQRSDNDGITFSEEKNISSERNNISSVYNPAFAVNGNNIYTAWGAWPSWGSRYGYVHFNSSRDLGQTWSNVDGSFGVCSSADFSTGSGNAIYIVLSSSYVPFENQIVLYKSLGEGLNWGSRITITSNSNDTYPIIKTDTVGNINTIFKRDSGYYYVRSINGGDTWTDPLLVTDYISSAYRQRLIDMAIDTGGNMYIVSEFDNSGILYFTRSR